MLLEPDQSRGAEGPIWKSAKIQALHDIRDEERQQRLRIKGEIRLAPRRSKRELEKERLASLKPGDKIIRGAKRQHVVTRLAATLNESNLSPFEHEAACRHGVRSMLCGDGHPWHHSDAEAAALVEEGLKRIHAVRPTYDEGQREYSVSPDYCSWCHSPLEDVPGTRKVSYCDETCARSALQAREINHHRRETRAFNAAWEVVQRSRHAACACEECGKSFRPSRLDMPNRFCSRRCANEHRARTMARPARTCPTCSITFHPARASQVHCSPKCGFEARKTVPTCNCAHCGKAFQPASNSKGKNRFCSQACHYAHGHTEIRCTCSWCGVSFLAKGRAATVCGDRCRQTAAKYRLGTVPQLLVPHVFDHFVSVPSSA